MKLDYWAKIVIHGYPKMKANKRKDLASWLKKLSYEVLDDEDFGHRFTARLMK